MPIIKIYKGEALGECRSLIDHIELLQSKLLEIPEEFRVLGTIELSGYEWQGSGYVDIEIYYTRPESEADVNARKEGEEQAILDMVKADLAELKRLKAAYEESGIDLSAYGIEGN